MKSYFLEELDDHAAACAALDDLLPGQSSPWLVLTTDGDDIVAYIRVEEETEGDTRGPFVMHANISGRHYYRDQDVIDVLSLLQKRLGGTIRNDNDELIVRE